jgi:hypothetical protein
MVVPELFLLLTFFILLVYFLYFLRFIEFFYKNIHGKKLEKLVAK